MPNMIYLLRHGETAWNRERRLQGWRDSALTDRGRAALAQAYPLWKDVQAQVAKSLGPDRFRRLLSDLRATVALTRTS